MEQITRDVVDRIGEILTSGDAPVKSLALFAAESGVRVMSIHKSKGLEFDTVVVPAVEHEMFFGNPGEARAAFFVAMSRAKRNLLLTYVDTSPAAWSQALGLYPNPLSGVPRLCTCPRPSVGSVT